MGKRDQAGFSPVEGLLILVILGILGGAGWYVYSANNKANDTLDSANKSASSIIAKKGTKSKKPATTPVAPSVTELENIKASITSKNTAALEGYMASSVNVVIAASEKQGAESPTLAVKDVDYVSGGTEPWNFSLPAATLTKYQTGDYKQYFPSTALVGKSANNYVISFGFDNAGKINVIFMTNQASVLEP